MDDTILRRTWAEIDLDALAHNYHQAREKIGPAVKYLGVVKADAYGHGAVQISRKLEALGADYLAVSSLDEARELRHAGICAPLLVLGHTPPELTPQLIQYHITQTVSAQAKAEAYDDAAAKCGGRLKVHIKVDTGMSRLGFLVRGEHFDGGVEAIAASCALGHLEPEGIFTHFSVADEDDAASEDYTQEQFGLFMRVLEALYGAGADRDRLGLRPVMTLKSCISTIKIFDPETDISYGRTFRTAHKTRVGVLPIGYADGLFRGLSGCMAVQTDQGPAPILGRICMDMTMVDLTELPDVHVGDTVELFGVRQRADVLADILGTIPYELTCAVSKRVPRLYMENGAVVERSLRLLL